MTAPLNLIVASLKQTAARCRVLETTEPVTLRATGLWRVVPGEILTIQPRKRWTYAKNTYLSGEITGASASIFTGSAKGARGKRLTVEVGA